ncbi:hypothetical protein J2S58_002375 [Nakamurella flavida]|nr:hypothetical protein [Nakamurella flavida]
MPVSDFRGACARWYSRPGRRRNRSAAEPGSLMGGTSASWPRSLRGLPCPVLTAPGRSPCGPMRRPNGEPVRARTVGPAVDTGAPWETRCLSRVPLWSSGVSGRWPGPAPCAMFRRRRRRVARAAAPQFDPLAGNGHSADGRRCGRGAAGRTSWSRRRAPGGRGRASTVRTSSRCRRGSTSDWAEPAAGPPTGGRRDAPPVNRQRRAAPDAGVARGVRRRVGSWRASRTPHTAGTYRTIRRCRPGRVQGRAGSDLRSPTCDLSQVSSVGSGRPAGRGRRPRCRDALDHLHRPQGHDGRCNASVERERAELRSYSRCGGAPAQAHFWIASCCFVRIQPMEGTWIGALCPVRRVHWARQLTSARSDPRNAAVQQLPTVESMTCPQGRGSTIRRSYR